MKDDESQPLFASAVREAWRLGYSWKQLRGDIFAGLTVGIVAIPLAMALAIASGAPPQYGLYTAIIAGFIIAVTGGSRFNISGPTAAFVVILLPITHDYGLGGLMIATIMAGIMMFGMGITGMGKFIEYIPYPVTMGFTAGIGVVIATLQIKDFLGLSVETLDGHFLNKIFLLIQALPTAHFPDMVLGCLTLGVMLGWPRLKTTLPAPLVALIVGSGLAWGLGYFFPEFHAITINDKFNGIPSQLPQFILPWELPNAKGDPVGLSFNMIKTLLGSAFAIAMLGAIESLLCAVVADGMTGTKHNPNAELIGQGLGNIIAPFFGGISATAAIARTATNIRSGATTPLSAIVHAFFLLVVLISLSKLLGYVPMATLAALLLIVAWNMSDAKGFMRLLQIAPRGDLLVLFVCFGLTVLFDMTISVTAGLILAAMLFIRQMAELTGAELVEDHQQHIRVNAPLPEHVVIYDINGPLFFGAAEKAMKTLQIVHSDVQVLILDMQDVSLMDVTGMMALEALINDLNKNNVLVIISGLQPRLILRLRKAGIRKIAGKIHFSQDLNEAVSMSSGASRRHTIVPAV
jgi:sulfate permease, SulP family